MGNSLYDTVKATDEYTKKMLNNPLGDAMKPDENFNFNKQCEEYLDDFEARINLQQRVDELEAENDRLKGEIDHQSQLIQAMEEKEVYVEKS